MSNCWSQHKKEYLIYALISVLAMLFPLFSAVERAFTDGSFTWEQTLFELNEMVIFLIVTWIHITVLLPMLFDKRRTWKYLFWVVSLLGIFLISNYTLHNYAMRQLVDMHIEAEMQSPDQIDEELPPLPPHLQAIDKAQLAEQKPRLHRIGPSLIDTLIVALLFGCTIAIKLMFKHQENVRKLEELDKIRIQQELTQLKAQLSPHFFMNSLNNIHGLVEIDPTRAQDMILELSGMMRYVLYESASATTTLSKEIAFLGNYISLMRVRYASDRVTINHRFPSKEEACTIQIPPLILIIFIENAFKHGVSYEKHSFVNIELDIRQNHLVLNCANSLHDDTQMNKSGGIGLSNIRKRLDILYADRYTLEISKTSNQFSITLSIPIKDENQVHSR